MPMYTNIGGGSKQLTSLYINKDGSNKALNNAYGNINGSSKLIFSATKYYWYKQYPVNGYTLCDAGSYWRDSSSTSTGLYIRDFYSTDESIVLFSSMTYFDNDPEFRFGGYTTVKYDYNRTEHDSNDISYYLNPSYNGYYYKENDNMTFKISTETYKTYLEVIYHDTYVEYKHSLGISAAYYRVPNSHSTTNYNTIKSATKYSLKSVSTGNSTDGLHRTVATVSSASKTGYIISSITDNSGDYKAYYCDGYYYEYLGYYA